MILIPLLRLLQNDLFRLLLGLSLTLLTLLASIGLLSLSGWFLTASFLSASVFSFNFFYPSSAVRGFALLRTIARYGERLITHDITFRLLAQLRMMIFKKLLPLSPHVFAHLKSSDVLNVLVGDVDTLDSLYLALINPFISALMIIAFLGIGIAFISPSIALLVVLSLLLMLVLLPTVFYHLGSNLGHGIIVKRSYFRSQIIQWVALNREFTIFNRLSQQALKLSEAEQSLADDQSRQARLAGISSALVIAFNGLLTTLVILLASSATLPDIEQSQTLIALLVFASLATIEVLMPISGVFLQLGQIIMAAKRVEHITTQRAIEYGELENLDLSCGNALEYRGVDFYYGKHQVLSSVDLVVKKGEKIAIVGTTGSGKSTIFNLLNRIIEPQSGEILLSNTPIKALTKQRLRTHLVTLSQNVHIFNQSVRENLTFGREHITDERIAMVLKSLGLEHLLDLDMILGNGGRVLSGGETKRFGLARIFLSDAPLVLLDEPTEGLDRQAEASIMQQINAQLGERTLICITHRERILPSFDKIYRLSNGKLLSSDR